MTRFENTGAQLQYGAQTKKIAAERLDRSCSICCAKGFRIECEKCAIQQAHRFIMDCLSVPSQSPMRVGV